MILLIDIGNSRLKWAAAVNDGINAGSPIYHHKGQFDDVIVNNEWRQLDRPTSIIISNVAGQQIADNLVNLINRLWQKTPFFAQSAIQQFGVRNGYENPSQLGVDRWVAMLAAARHYSLPACIIDCGSAITIDVIDVSGLHLGGLIAPGVNMMKQSIIRGTKLVNCLQEQFPIGLSTNTEAAINSGVFFASIGLIIQTVENELTDHRIGFKSLLMCGGDAEIISAHLKYSVVIDQNLIFKGLRILGQEFY